MDFIIFTAPTEEWVCPECVLIMTAENMDTRSRAMRLLTVDQLIVLLRHALARMRTVSGKYSDLNLNIALCSRNSPNVKLRLDFIEI